MCWNHEIPWLIISGSWDTTIKAWDIRNSSCIYTLGEHHADVYGINTHPECPFVLVSCSRDTTLRFWQIEDPAFVLLNEVILDYSLYDIIADANDAMPEGSIIKLCGNAGRELLSNVKQLKYTNDVEKYRSLMKFFAVFLFKYFIR